MNGRGPITPKPWGLTYSPWLLTGYPHTSFISHKKAIWKGSHVAPTLGDENNHPATNHVSVRPGILQVLPGLGLFSWRIADVGAVWDELNQAKETA